MSFARNMSKNVGKNISKNKGSKYNHKIFDNAKKSATDVIKTASKRAIQNITDKTGDLIGKMIPEKNNFTTK